MAKPLNDVYSPCESCDRETWHEVLHQHAESVDEPRVDIVHQMLSCKGCKTLSFRKAVMDYESSYPVDDNNWHVPKEIFDYPRVLKGHKKLDDLSGIPTLVREIYTQSLHAVRDGSNILAGIGLRATVEAICNEQSIQGKILDKRIDGLAKAGLISQRDAERLHTIRFLGNDAAHEIRARSESNLLIALRIVEHLLVTLYVLDRDADGKLDTIIRSSQSFVEALDKKVAAFKTGDEIPIAMIFGKDIRRLHGYAPTHEAYLIKEIKSGNYTKLSLGKVDYYAHSKEKLQHFVVT